MALGVDSAITISGLKGAMAAMDGLARTDGRQLALSCADASNFSDIGCNADPTSSSKAVWNSTKGTVVFFPLVTLEANKLQTVCFDIHNPDYAMQSPTIYIETGGSEASPPDAMWVNTAIKAIAVDHTQKCFPGSDSDPPPAVSLQYDAGELVCSGECEGTPTLTVTTASRVKVLPTTVLENGVNVSESGIGNCPAGKLRFEATGVKNLEVISKGCGCSGEGSGTLVVGEEEDKGNIKFVAKFSIGYTCDKPSNTSSSESTYYDTLEECLNVCSTDADVLDPETGSTNQGDIYTCHGSIHPASIQTLNPGWGYTTPPTIRFSRESQAKFGCSGAKFQATLNEGTGFLARTDVVFVSSSCTSPYSTKEACELDDCGTCTGVPLFSEVTTVDGKVLPGLVYENEGRGYVAAGSSPDVLSLRSDDADKAACTWGQMSGEARTPTASTGPLSDWIGIEDSSLAMHVKSIDLPPAPVNASCDTNPNAWNNFLGPVTVNVTYATSDETAQEQCSSLLHVEMAPAPLFVADKSYEGWSKFGDSAPLTVCIVFMHVRLSATLVGNKCKHPLAFGLRVGSQNQHFFMMRARSKATRIFCRLFVKHLHVRLLKKKHEKSDTCTFIERIVCQRRGLCSTFLNKRSCFLFLMCTGINVILHLCFGQTVTSICMMRAHITFFQFNVWINT